MQVATAVVVAQDDQSPAPAGGLGFGARPLMPIANRPLVFHVMDALRAGGVERVALLVGGRGQDAVCTAVGDGRRWGMEIEAFQGPHPRGLTAALYEASGFLEGEPFLLHQGDALVREPIGELGARFAGEDLDALVLRLPPSHARGRRAAPAQVSPLAAVGGCFLSQRALDERALGAPGDLQGLLTVLHANGGRVRMEQVDGCQPCQGGRDGLLDANRRALEGIGRDYEEADIADSEIQGPVIVHHTASIHNATVRGPVVIGPRANVSQAFVGPYTAIGADVVIEGAEVENSILLDGAHVRLLRARLESSILGRDARVGRDFSLPRAVRMVVGDNAEITVS